jgi:GH24 family phage-related lysozyme (muramidase)
MFVWVKENQQAVLFGNIVIRRFMKKTVLDIFPSFTEKFEGYVAYMYLDVKGLVTCGCGNLIDPVSQAVNLPFTKKDGTKASKVEIIAEWTSIKLHTELAKEGHKSAQKYCNLRLSDEAISNLVRSKLEQNEDYLIKHYFADFNFWPADAQLAVLSMAWALGAGFPTKWTTLKNACLAHDWLAAAKNCHINEVGNPGIKPRNEANVRLFNSAAEVVKVKTLEIDLNEKNRIEGLVALTMIQSME